VFAKVPEKFNPAESLNPLPEDRGVTYKIRGCMLELSD